MNPWKALSIKPTDDKKLIKKAYAGLLSQATVEGNNKEIAHVKMAYNLILQIIALKNISYDATYYQPSETFDDLKNQRKTFKNIDAEMPNSKDVESDNKSTLKINEQFNELELQKADDFLEKIAYVAFRKQIHRINLRHWRFLKTFKNDVSVGLQKQTGQKVFKLIARINLEAAGLNKPLVVPIQVIKQMGNVFEWHLHLEEYKKTMSAQEVGIMFSQELPSLKSKRKYIKRNHGKGLALAPANIGSRIGNFMFEIIGYSIPIFVIYIFKDWSYFELFKYGFLTIMALKFILEFVSDPTLRSIEEGREHRFYVVGENSVIPTFLQVPSRHFIIELTLFPVYAWIFGLFDENQNLVLFNSTIDFSVWTMVFVNFIVVHILSVVIYGKFFHDIATGTYVVQERIYDK